MKGKQPTPHRSPENSNLLDKEKEKDILQRNTTLMKQSVLTKI